MASNECVACDCSCERVLRVFVGAVRDLYVGVIQLGTLGLASVRLVCLNASGCTAAVCHLSADHSTGVLWC